MKAPDTDAVIQKLKALTNSELNYVRRLQLPVEAPQEMFCRNLWLRNLAGLEWGRRNGWWQAYGEDGPDPPAIQINAEDFEGKLMAHVMVAAGFFTSVGEAKRNGWDKPVVAGRYKVGRRKALEILTNAHRDSHQENLGKSRVCDEK